MFVFEDTCVWLGLMHSISYMMKEFPNEKCDSLQYTLENQYKIVIFIIN